MDQTASAAMMPKAPRILACVLCQNRKIKCDRNMPCSNCVKANVACQPSKPAPPRKRRRPNQDVLERLARCEELIKEYTGSSQPYPASPPRPQAPPSPTAITSSDDVLQHTSPRLVQHKGNMRYMENPLWSHLHDELRSMRDALASEDKDEEHSPLEACTPEPYSELIFGDPKTSNTVVEDLRPAPVTISPLWNIFLNRVNPLTKVVHIPTIQPYFESAMAGNFAVPRNIEALMFAVFATAVMSLEEENCTSIMGCSRKDALTRFSRGARLSLQKQSFMVDYDLVTVQALVLLQVTLQGEHDWHACWILNGIVIRLAQKLGLHRDGEKMGLPPFETEIRRRVWWAILNIDAKAALMSGLGHNTIPGPWDTKLPGNLNDADIITSATEPFVGVEGPTEMVFVLLINTLAFYMVRRPAIAQSDLSMIANIITVNFSKVDVERTKAFNARMAEMSNRLAEMLKRYCQPWLDPLNMTTHVIITQMMDKLRLFACDSPQPEWMRSAKTQTDVVFALVVFDIECRLKSYMSLEKTGFLWFVKSHFVMDLHELLASQLVYRTSGPVVDKAWELMAATYHYHKEFYNITEPTFHRLALVALRAWNKREAALTSSTAQPPAVPSFISRLKLLLPDCQSTSNSDTSTSPSLIDNSDLSMQGFENIRWEPMFGGHADNINFDWDIFSSSELTDFNTAPPLPMSPSVSLSTTQEPKQIPTQMASQMPMHMPMMMPNLLITPQSSSLESQIPSQMFQESSIFDQGML